MEERDLICFKLNLVATSMKIRVAQSTAGFE